MSLKGTQTEKNLAAAFAGESMARNRYTYFASVAKKQGYEQIAAIFMETAENEREHAKKFLKLMASDGHGVEIAATVPAIKIGKTMENLRYAAEGEHEEWTVGYKEAAIIADKEGFKEIANTFRNIALVEKAHEERFLLLLKHLERGTLFKRERAVMWKCRNCGFIVKAKEAPIECPACGHPQGFYEIREILE